MSDERFLSRWSRLKRASAAGADAPAADAVPAQKAAPPAVPAEPPRPPEAAPLPPVESLTPESDFAGFMREGVDPLLRRQALRTLFQDPRFNVMDRLDVYIDDYSQPDPLPAGWLEKLNQTARLGGYREPEEKQSEPAIADDASAPPVAEDISEENQRVDTDPEAPAEGGEEDASDRAPPPAAG